MTHPWVSRVLRCGNRGPPVPKAGLSRNARLSHNRRPRGPEFRKLFGSGDGSQFAAGKHVPEQGHQLVLNEPVRRQDLIAV